MNQAQVEKIIQDRISELAALEQSEHLNRLRVSLQDKRDELENLLLRIRGLDGLQTDGIPPSSPLTSR